MKSFKTIVLIGIIIFSIMFLWSCKKNEIIELEPIIAGSKSNATFSISNVTTESTTQYEVNDTEHIIANGNTGTSDDIFENFDVVLYQNGVKVYAIASAYNSQEQWAQIASIDIDKVINDGLDGPVGDFDTKLIYTVKSTIDGSEQDYTIDGNKITITAEKDYDIDAIKGAGYSKGIMSGKMDELAEILSQPDVVSNDGNNYDKATLIKYFKKMTNGDKSDFELLVLRLKILLLKVQEQVLMLYFEKMAKGQLQVRLFL